MNAQTFGRPQERSTITDEQMQWLRVLRGHAPHSGPVPLPANALDELMVAGLAHIGPNGEIEITFEGVAAIIQDRHQ